jgi:predicted O-methyltransferase YrrM
MEYKDIQGWFPDKSAEVLSEVIKQHEVKDVIEVGAFLGRSTVFFANECKHVTSIDPFTLEGWKDGQANGDARRAGENFYQKFVDNIIVCGVAHKVTSIVASSANAEKEHPELSADLIYVDAAHDYESVLEDIKRWLPHTKKVICGDDYDEHWHGVRRAVDELLPDRIVEGRIWYKVI